MIKASNSTDQELLDGLKGSDPKAINRIYDLALPAVIYWVKENNGGESDARDIFQEALIAIYRKVETGEFVLSCTLKSYLRILSRNIWLARLRNKGKVNFTALDQVEEPKLDADILARIEASEREQLYLKHFDQLEENCRKILQWFFDKVSLKEIAKKLNTSEGYIKKRKFICKERLISAIQGDPLFEELKSPQ